MKDSRRFPVYVTTGLFVLLFCVGAVQYDGFGSLRVIFNLLTDNAFLAITALGMTFVILSGGIDLSVGAVIAFSGVLAATLLNAGWHPLAAFLLVLAAGCVFGTALGVVIHLFRLQPFIVTLAGMFLMRGLAILVSEQSIPIEHPFYEAANDTGIRLPGGAFLGVPVILLALVFGGAFVVAHCTRFGSRVYALGGGMQTAQLMGVPVGRTTIAIYALSSTLAAFSGIVFSLYTSSGYALAATGLELDAIAAVVIGGTLLTGGAGYVAGTLMGVMLMGLVQTYISFNGTLNGWWTKIVIGLLVLLFVVLQKLPLARVFAGRDQR